MVRNRDALGNESMAAPARSQDRHLRTNYALRSRNLVPLGELDLSFWVLMMQNKTLPEAVLGKLAIATAESTDEAWGLDDEIVDEHFELDRSIIIR